MIRKLGPSVYAICLSISLASCTGVEWNWKPNPYVGDSRTLSMVNAAGEIIKCDQTAFDDITGFDSDNLAELEASIASLPISKRQKRKIISIIKKARSK